MSNRNTCVKNTNKTNSRPSFVASKPNTHITIAVSLPNKNNYIQQPKKNKQNNNRRSNKKKVYEDDSSSSSSSSEESDTIVLPIKASKKKSNHYKRPVIPIDYKSLVDQVYAGPTFNNAPAPSSLPLPPVFNARGSPTILPHPINTAYEMEQTSLALSEIQRGLRSMLKIES